MHRVIVYARISNAKGGKSRSVEQQEDVLREEIESRPDWEIVGVVKDSMSASRFEKRQRPGFIELQAQISDGKADIVAVYEFSRITRKGPGTEWEALADLLRTNNVLVYDYGINRTLDMRNDDDQYVAETAASLAKLESARISKRVRRDSISRAAKGEVHSTLGFGWTKDDHGEWVVDTVAAEAIRVAVNDVVNGTANLTQIAKRWNADGLTTSRGNAWNNGKVRLALTRPTLAGIRVAQGERLSVAGKWPTILSVPEHAQIVGVLTDPSRLKHRGVAPTHLLTGIARCGATQADGTTCNRRLSWAGAGRYNSAYRCPLGHVNRSEPDLDNHVEEKLFEAIEGYRADLFVMNDKIEPDDSESTAVHLAEVAKLEARLTEVGKLYATGVVPLEEYVSMQQLIRPQIAAARAQAEQAAPNRDLYNFAMNAEELWAGADLDWKRRFVRAAVEVVVHPIPDKVGRNARVFDPAFVSVRFLGYGTPVEITDDYVRGMTDRLTQS
ncbi:recombinase family protein [Rhodococcus sp. IEGM 1370]|uniref:recombinase family protein n=1 Tax=Rhodococcus sp. IEGM 1370 TaxID=3082222 RepID=UPI0029553860|nr:recombinase family protein [Rhodococcus sp. IEGM 1370]MDV8078833.1 recombinase family protein [Rhodococcus sp. IEGM 1370]